MGLTARDEGEVIAADAPAVPRVKHRVLRLVLIAFFLVLGAAAFAVFVSTGDVVGGAFLGLVAALLCWFWAWHMWDRFRGGMHEDVIEATGGADAKRVLYLRPFEHDDQPVLLISALLVVTTFTKALTSPVGYLRRFWLLYTARVTWSQLLSVAAKPVGPVIAIGEPGETAPTLGLKNEYVGDDWRERVTELVQASELVVLQAGLSDSVTWEIGTVTALLRPEQLLVYVGNRSKRLRDRRKRARAEFYAEFAESSGHFFPRGLPAEMGRSRFVRFGPEWIPIAHRRKRFFKDPPPNIRVADYMETVL